VKNLFLNRLAFSGLYDDGESFWVIMLRFNALFKINKKSFKAEYKGSFPDEQVTLPCLYIGVAFYNGKLYFSPYNAKEIAGYDIDTDMFFKIRIPWLKSSCESVRFISLFQYSSYIFFVGENGVIVKYSPDEEEWQYFYCLVGDNDILFSAVHANENILALASKNKKSVLLFNMDTCESHLNYIGNEIGAFSGICFDGENYWISPLYEGSVVKWNAVDNSCKMFCDYPKGFSVADARESFFFAHYSNGFVWLFPHGANMVLKINVCDGTISIAEEFQQKLGCEADTCYSFNYLFATVSDNMIYSFIEKTNKFVLYNTETSEIVEKLILIDPEEKSKMEKHFLQAFAEIYKKVYLHKEDIFLKYFSVDFNDYIDYICNNRCYDGLENKSHNVYINAGDIIYKHLKYEVLKNELNKE